MKWAVLHHDGTLTIREDEPSLMALQEAVHGQIEVVKAPEGTFAVSFFINETRRSVDGEPLALNVKATEYLGPVLWQGTRIVGPMVIAGPPDPMGELKSLTDEQVSYLQDLFDD